MCVADLVVLINGRRSNKGGSAGKSVRWSVRPCFELRRGSPIAGCAGGWVLSPREGGGGGEPVQGGATVWRPGGCLVCGHLGYCVTALAHVASHEKLVHERHIRVMSYQHKGRMGRA